MRNARRVILLAVAAALLSGCSYVCHSYKPFAIQAFDGEWQIRGVVNRRQREDAPQAPGSVHHWPPDARDRWWVELTPIARDTTWWDHGDVDLRDLIVVAGNDTIRLTWEKKVDLAREAEENIYADGSHAIHRRTSGMYRFESAYFHLPEDAPPALTVRCRLVLTDADSGRVVSERPLEFKAILDRHRRKDVSDLIDL